MTDLPLPTMITLGATQMAALASGARKVAAAARVLSC
jgi:hypothetical protein